MLTRSEFIKLALAASVIPTGARAEQSSQGGTRPRKLVLIAGPRSHPPLMHEFRAGTILLEKRLQDIPNLIVDRHEMGWVTDEQTFHDADAVVCFSDGNKKHPALAGKGRINTLESLVKQGVGFGCMHYAVEVPIQQGTHLRKWMGGCYEKAWSCNPIWKADFKEFPQHPITQGVSPFSINDEWYFNMRFQEGFSAEGASEIDGVTFTPILSAIPSDDVRDGPYVYPRGPYNHIKDASGRKEAVMWAIERPDGGRGFGFTGGHFHHNWQDDNFRKIILNALCWVSKVEIPTEGIVSDAVTSIEIIQNLDKKR